MADIVLPKTDAAAGAVVGSPAITTVTEATGENRRRLLAMSDVLPTAASTHGTVMASNFALEAGVESPYVGGNELQVPRARQFTGHNGYIVVLMEGTDEDIANGTAEERGESFVQLCGGSGEETDADFRKSFWVIGVGAGNEVGVRYELDPSTTDDADRIALVYSGTLPPVTNRTRALIYEAQSAPQIGITQEELPIATRQEMLDASERDPRRMSPKLIDDAIQANAPRGGGPGVPSGGGLDQAAVDDRIALKVKDFADEDESVLIQAADLDAGQRRPETIDPADATAGTDTNIRSWSAALIKRVVTGSVEFVRNQVASMLEAGTNVTLDKSTTGATRKVTINASGGGGGLNQGDVDDRIEAKVRDFAEEGGTAKVEKADLATDQQAPDPVPDNEATAGTETTVRAWSAAQVKRVVTGSIAFVRDQIFAMLVGGSNVTLVPTGTGSARTLRIDSPAGQPGTGEANPPDVTQAEAEAGTLAANKSWSPLRVMQAIAKLAVPTKAQVYTHVKSIVRANRGLQVGDDDDDMEVTVGQVELRRTDAQVEALATSQIAIFARVMEIVGISRDKFQQMVNAFTGGGWADAAGAGDLRATHWYVGLPSATEWTAANIGTATLGQRFRVSPRRVNQWVPISQPIAIEDTAPRARARFNVRTTAEHDPDAEYIDNYPLKDIAPFYSDSTYNYYKIQVADIPVSASIQVQLNTPFETDPNHLTIPEVPGDVSNTEATAGTEPGTRLWSPANITTAITGYAFRVITGRWIRDKLQGLLPANRLSYTFLKDTPHIIGDTIVETRTETLTLAGSGVQQDNRPTAPFYFSPAFDLDDDDKQHGEFHISVDLRLHTVSAGGVNLGFVRGKANQTEADRERAHSGTIFASDLREEDMFVLSATEDQNTLTVITQAAYSLNTLAGTYYFALVHNANNEAGFYHWWDGEAGAETASLTAEIRISWTPTDTFIPDIPTTGSALGRMVGRTTALPTAMVARGTSLGPNPGVGGAFAYNWIVPPGVQIAQVGTPGYTQIGVNPAANIFQTVQFLPPFNPLTADVIGLWVRSKVGDDYIQTIGPLPWGPSPLTTETSQNDDAEATLIFAGGGTNDGQTLAQVIVKWRSSDSGYSSIFLEGDGDVLPANSTVEIFEAVVRGAKGETGDPAAADSIGITQLAPAVENRIAPATTGNANRTLRANSGATEIEYGYAFVRITQAAYDALGTKDANTLYIIIG